MKIFVTSDTHFNHANIIHFCNRPFADVAEMNEAMIAAWNSVVSKKDKTFVLGDFSYKARKEGDIEPEEILARLNGEKHLIIGNHDLEYKIDKLQGWASVQHYLEFRHEGKRFVMSHYPMETWRNAQHRWLMLHGHAHGGMKRTIAHRFDVGVDAVGVFHPLPIMHFADLAKDQVYEPQDGHGD